MGELYTKNDISKLMRISYKAIRGYEQKGLITPNYVSQNGYKYYSSEQLFTIDMIRYSSQHLGMSLSEIKDILGQTNDSRELVEYLNKKRKQLEEMVHSYQTIIQNIDYSLTLLNSTKNILVPYIQHEDGTFYYYPLVENTFFNSKSTVMRISEIIKDDNMPVTTKSETFNNMCDTKIGVFYQKTNDNIDDTMLQEKMYGRYVCIKYYDYVNNTEYAKNIVRQYALDNNLHLSENESWFFFQSTNISTVKFEDFLVELKIRIIAD